MLIAGAVAAHGPRPLAAKTDPRIDCRSMNRGGRRFEATPDPWRHASAWALTLNRPRAYNRRPLPVKPRSWRSYGCDDPVF